MSGAANAIYRCKIHGDFVVPTLDGLARKFEDCTAITGMNEDKTAITHCGMQCTMTPLISLLDKVDPDIRGLTPKGSMELIETVRQIRKDMGDKAFSTNRFITQEQIDKTINIMTLEKKLKEAREEMIAELERPFEI
jgi:hypothetical protein